MGFLDAFVFVAILSFIALYIKNRFQEVQYITSKIDGEQYLVRRAEDSQQAADTLASMNQKIENLIKHLQSAYPDDIRVALLVKRYDRSALSEGGHNSGYTSFSVNKGERIVMCIRSRHDDSENGEIETFNTLMYVLLHEIAHLITEEIGHTPKFWDNFRWLLEEAHKIGVYTKIDYSQDPEDYCGIQITSSAAHQKK